MTQRPDGRHQITVTMKPDIYELLYEHCRVLDQPVTVFVRELIKRELDNHLPTQN